MHGQNITVAFREMRIDDQLARSVIVICTFIPLFAFRELQRVLGEGNVRALFFRARATTNADLPSKICDRDCALRGLVLSHLINSNRPRLLREAKLFFKTWSPLRDEAVSFDNGVLLSRMSQMHR
jgi:hypothetical protein